MQILKFQFEHDEQAQAAAPLLQQIAHVVQGSSVTVHISHKGQLNPVINVLAGLGAHTIGTITYDDLIELWKVRKSVSAKEFYFDQLI